MNSTFCRYDLVVFWIYTRIKNWLTSIKLVPFIMVVSYLQESQGTVTLIKERGPLSMFYLQFWCDCFCFVCQRLFCPARWGPGQEDTSHQNSQLHDWRHVYDVPRKPAHIWSLGQRHCKFSLYNGQKQTRVRRWIWNFPNWIARISH